MFGFIKKVFFTTMTFFSFNGIGFNPLNAKKGWINPIDFYGWLQWCFRYWLGRRYVDNKRQIATWKGIATRF